MSVTVKLNGGFYFKVDQPIKGEDEPFSNYWCISLEHDEIDTEMDQLACSVNAHPTAKAAITAAVKELQNEPLEYFDPSSPKGMLIPEFVKQKYLK